MYGYNFTFKCQYSKTSHYFLLNFSYFSRMYIEMVIYLNNYLKDNQLKKNLETLFVDPRKIQGPLKQNELAAMITAATEMSTVSHGISSPETTMTELLDLYGKKEDPEVTNLIGMNPTFVKSNIGYSIDFKDIASV